VPKEYLLDATDWHRQPDAFAPHQAKVRAARRHGQSIFVDPERKPALVITGAAKNASVGKAPFASERDARRRGIVGRYGSW
jgi:hypothetical protein